MKFKQIERSLQLTYRGKVMQFDANSDVKRCAEMDWVRHYVTKVIVPHELLPRLLQLSLKRGHPPNQLIKHALQVPSLVKAPELQMIIFIDEHNERIVFITEYTT